MNIELINYIIRFYVNLFNENERKALRHIHSIIKLGPVQENDTRLEMYKRTQRISSDPKVLELIENGYDKFYERTAKRILTEYPEKVFINECPKCGKLARTPTAKQCRFCQHKWFDSKTSS